MFLGFDAFILGFGIGVPICMNDGSCKAVLGMSAGMKGRGNLNGTCPGKWNKKISNKRSEQDLN